MCAVRVFRVLLLLCCVFVVPFVIFAILLPFASLDDYSQSVCTGLLRVVVCLCVCLYFVVPFVFLVFSSVVYVLFCFLMTIVSCVCRLCVFLLSVFLSVCLNTIFYFLEMSPPTHPQQNHDRDPPTTKAHHGRARSMVYGIGYRV